MIELAPLFWIPTVLLVDPDALHVVLFQKQSSNDDQKKKEATDRSSR